jgi:Icc-related predicted phosphoesterase
MAERRKVRIAAVGDLHLDGRSGRFRETFARVNREADVLAVCGDITTHGEPDQARAFVDELEGVEIPVVAVLGNHDHEHEADGRGTWRCSAAAASTCSTAIRWSSTASASPG